MTIHFLSDDLTDARVTLYTQRHFFAWIPLVQSPIIQGRAIFPFSPTTPMNFALIVRNEGELVARTGRTDLSSGQWDPQAGTFESSYYFQAFSEPMGLPLSLLQDRLPDLPMTIADGGTPLFRLDRLEVEIQNGRMYAEGDGEYLRRGAGPLAVRYEFRLRPHRGLLTVQRLMEVETVFSEVRSVRTGIGRVSNPAINLVLRIMRKRLAEMFQSNVQEAIDEGVTGQLQALDQGEDWTVTLQALTANPTEGILAWPCVLVNMQQITCPARLGSTNRLLRSRQEVSELRSLRDQLLSGTVRGERYLKYFDAHRKELLRLLMSDAKLRQAVDQALRHSLKDFKVDTPDKTPLSSATLAQLRQSLRLVETAASPALAADCKRLEQELEGFSQHPVGEVLRNP